MMFKSVEAVQQFSREQMEAASATAAAFTSGVQQLIAETTDMSKKTVETGADAFQNLLASKSMDRAVQIQMDFAKSSYESMMAGSSKLASIVSATAQDMARPLEGAFKFAQDAARGTLAA